MLFLLIRAIALDITEVATHRINEASEQQAEGADIRKCRTDNEIKRLFNMPGTMTEDEIRDQVESNRRIRTPIKPVQLRGVLPTSTMATIAPTSTIPTEVGGSPYAFSFSANLENNGNVGNVAAAETSKDRFHRRKTTLLARVQQEVLLVAKRHLEIVCAVMFLSINADKPGKPNNPSLLYVIRNSTRVMLFGTRRQDVVVRL